jgi:hypothetical protein
LDAALLEHSTKILNASGINATKILDVLEHISTEILDAFRINATKILDALEHIFTEILDASCHGQRHPRCSAPLPILSEKENTFVLYFRTRSLGSCIKRAYYYKVQS